MVGNYPGQFFITRKTQGCTTADHGMRAKSYSLKPIKAVTLRALSGPKDQKALKTKSRTLWRKDLLRTIGYKL